MNPIFYIRWTGHTRKTTHATVPLRREGDIFLAKERVTGQS
jgi:hypothetical protein